MHMNNDHALMAAISRGCEGSHSMGDMSMIGSMHSTCADFNLPTQGPVSSLVVTWKRILRVVAVESMIMVMGIIPMMMV